MKLHWKVAMIMLVGLLLAGQVFTLNYARAQSMKMAEAARELGNAKQRIADEAAAQKALLATWTKMNSMSMSKMDRQIMNFLRDSARERALDLEGQRSMAGAVERIWGELKER